VRSGRITDIGVLAQYGKPIFGYAGGANLVVKAIDSAPIVDESLRRHRRRTSATRIASLRTTSTRAPKRCAPRPSRRRGAPEPVFTYDHSLPDGAKRAKTLHIPFSGYSDVYWKWQGGKWLRSHGTVPHTLENGDQVSAKNVVIQVVKTKQGPVSDVKRRRLPEVIRPGAARPDRVPERPLHPGNRKRPKVSDLHGLRGPVRGSDPAPAREHTWVELVPAGIAVTT
jgi:hypothetical protein